MQSGEQKFPQWHVVVTSQEAVWNCSERAVLQIFSYLIMLRHPQFCIIHC
jgi:hypothetical protein